MTDPKAKHRIYALRQPFIAFEARPWRPAHNLYETDRGVVVVVDLAGVNPATLHVHLHAQQIAVHGVRQLTVPAGIRRVEQMEIVGGPFQLDVALPRPIDPESAEARYSGGLLEIGLPFAQKPEPRVVVIRVEGGS